MSMAYFTPFSCASIVGFKQLMFAGLSFPLNLTESPFLNQSREKTEYNHIFFFKLLCVIRVKDIVGFLFLFFFFFSFFLALVVRNI